MVEWTDKHFLLAIHGLSVGILLDLVTTSLPRCDQAPCDAWYTSVVLKIKAEIAPKSPTKTSEPVTFVGMYTNHECKGA